MRKMKEEEDFRDDEVKVQERVKRDKSIEKDFKLQCEVEGLNSNFFFGIFFSY